MRQQSHVCGSLRGEVDEQNIVVLQSHHLAPSLKICLKRILSLDPLVDPVVHVSMFSLSTNHYKHVFPGMSKCGRRNPDLGKAKGGSLVFELVVATVPIDSQ